MRSLVGIMGTRLLHPNHLAHWVLEHSCDMVVDFVIYDIFLQLEHGPLGLGLGSL